MTNITTNEEAQNCQATLLKLKYNLLKNIYKFTNRICSNNTSGCRTVGGRTTERRKMSNVPRGNPQADCIIIIIIMKLAAIIMSKG
jgi:hypothetical protein